MCVHVPRTARRGFQSPGARITGTCGMSMWVLETNLGPLEEQLVRLTTAFSPQPQGSDLFCFALLLFLNPISQSDSLYWWGLKPFMSSIITEKWLVILTAFLFVLLFVLFFLLVRHDRSFLVLLCSTFHGMHSFLYSYDWHCLSCPTQYPIPLTIFCSTGL